MNQQVQKLNDKLQQYVEQLTEEYNQIPEYRKELLHKLASYISTQKNKHKKAELIFICTHNSRRSHLSQLWAQAAAYYYGIANVHTYSGGTEATAFNPNAVKAMQKAGFQINSSDSSTNPHYTVSFANEAHELIAFSKTYDAATNPQKDFGAIMTCSEADQNCPFIPGASIRISLAYEDPKAFDGTAQEEEKYDERSYQIAREMFYALSVVEDNTK